MRGLGHHLARVAGYLSGGNEVAFVTGREVVVAFVFIYILPFFFVVVPFFVFVRLLCSTRAALRQARATLAARETPL